MKKKSILQIQNGIIAEYRNTIHFRPTNEKGAYCYVPERIIYLHTDSFFNPTPSSLFDLLHEIGHIMTNKSGMKRCEEEYYATQWAISEMKKYDYMISDKRKDEFQQYIWKWRDTSIKLKAKTVPSREELTLKW
jgi:hypothetical protein